MHEVTEQQVDDLSKRFNHHPPKDGQVERYQAIRGKLCATALVVMHHTPPSREQSLALTKLEEAMFWANAAIARNE